MTESSTRSLRKFNPGTFQSNEEVKRQFVVRHHEFATVMEVLRENRETPSCQHVLIVAPRGRGKTMLLARLVAELRTHEMLGQSLWPVRLMEENQEIFTLADFWLEVLFQLAQECQSRAPGLARELQRIHASLVPRWREKRLEDYARAAVLAASDRLDRRLVLMVENLQALCQETDDHFGWKLRKTLQTEPQIMLVATATSRFQGLDDAEQAFFELFRIVHLAPLQLRECQCLWEMATGDQKIPQEIRPLQILTGGSPRLLIIMAGFARHRSLQQLMEALVQLIDDYTEYFRSSLEGLAKTERRVFLAILDLWQPSGTGEIATRARMDVRTVSALLGRLVERGAVTVEGSGRKRQYAAAERLYCIYYKLRRERDEAAIVRHLIHFMVAFYRRSELTAISGVLRMEADVSPAIREGILRAMTDDQRIAGIFRDLAPSVIAQEYGVEARQAVALLVEGYEQRKEGKYQRALGSFNEALAYLAVCKERNLQLLMPYTMVMKGRVLCDLGAFRDALAVFARVMECFDSREDSDLQIPVATSVCAMGLLHWELGESEAALRACEDVVARFGTSTEPDIQRLVAGALYRKVTWKMANDEFAAGVLACDELWQRFGSSEDPEIHTFLASAIMDKSVAKSKLGEFEEALRICDEVIDRFDKGDGQEFEKEIAWALASKSILQLHFGKEEEAIQICDKVVERFGASTEPEVQINVAFALHGKYKQFTQRRELESAIAIGDEVINRLDTFEVPEAQELIATVLVDKAKLQVSVKLGEQALRTCDDLEQRLDQMTASTSQGSNQEATLLKWQTQLVRTQALLALGRQEAALGLFSQAYAQFTPGNDSMMQVMLAEVPDLVASGASARDLVEVLNKDQTKAAALTPLMVALRQLAGETVRAPAEVLEVAKDLRSKIETRQGIHDQVP